MSDTASQSAVPSFVMRWILILGFQSFLFFLLLLDVELPFLLLIALGVAGVAFVKPIWTVYGILATRIITTTATSFVRLGPVSLGFFEPTFALAYLSYLVKAMHERSSVLRMTPATLPIVLYGIMVFLWWFWSSDKNDGAHEIIVTVIFVCGFLMVSSALRTYTHIVEALWVFTIFTCFYGLLGMYLGTDDSSLYSDVQFKAMSQGGRTGGLGQQPNWFAMNLAFAVNPGFALAYIQKDTRKKLLAGGMTLITIIAMVSSGSRGGLYSVTMGIIWVSIFNAPIRNFFVKYWVAGGIAFALISLFSAGDIVAGLSRISSQGIDTLLEGNVRLSNWEACLIMFRDSFGMGIGTGGYEVWLAQINAKLAESTNKYPHGIIWSLMAHHGIFGIGFFILMCTRTGVSFVSAWRKVRGTELEVLLLGTSAAVIGYHAHALIEFEMHDKPFWEFFGLFWALILLCEEKASQPEALEALRMKGGLVGTVPAQSIVSPPPRSPLPSPSP